MTKDEVKALFKTGMKVTEASMASLVDFLEAQKGPKGDTGAKGADGYGTKAEFEALAARVAKLENPAE